MALSSTRPQPALIISCRRVEVAAAPALLPPPRLPLLLPLHPHPPSACAAAIAAAAFSCNAEACDHAATCCAFAFHLAASAPPPPATGEPPLLSKATAACRMFSPAPVLARAASTACCTMSDVWLLMLLMLPSPAVTPNSIVGPISPVTCGRQHTYRFDGRVGLDFHHMHCHAQPYCAPTHHPPTRYTTPVTHTQPTLSAGSSPTPPAALTCRPSGPPCGLNQAVTLPPPLSTYTRPACSCRWTCVCW